VGQSFANLYLTSYAIGNFMTFKKIFTASVAFSALLLSLNASADTKVVYVDVNQIMQSAPALAISKKLQDEFSPRINELNNLKKQLDDKKAALNNSGKNLSESDLKTKSNEISNLSLDLERKDRELKEDAELRKRDEMKKFQDKINATIYKVAEQDGDDLVIYNGVAYGKKQINITDKVIAALGQ
jgi:outer membrane protein